MEATHCLCSCCIIRSVFCMPFFFMKIKKKSHFLFIGHIVINGDVQGGVDGLVHCPALVLAFLDAPLE